MKENLEKYLREKRLRLDVEEPENDLIWEGIRSGISQKKQGLPNLFWKVAAIFIFVVSLSYFVVNETSRKQIVVVTLADVSEELGLQEKELKQQVDLKWEEIKPLVSEDNPEFQFLLAKMNELDELYEIYQNDLAELGANEQIISALLDNYEKRIKILNRLLLEIEKQNRNEETFTL